MVWLCLLSVVELPSRLQAVPPAHERMVRAYSDGPLRLRYSGQRPNSPSFEIEVFCSGGAFLVEQRVEGEVVLVKRPRPGLSFSLVPNGEGGWRVGDLSRSDAPFDPAAQLFAVAPPLTAPFASFETAILDYFDDRALVIDDIHESAGPEGEAEVHVSWSYGADGEMVGRTVFLPDRSWVISRHERTPDWKKGFSRWSVRYGGEEIGGVPVPLGYRNESLPAGKQGNVLAEFELVDLSYKVPANRLALSWYGLPDDLGLPPRAVGLAYSSAWWC